MAKLDFPNNPVNGSTYIADNGITYTYDNTSLPFGVWLAKTTVPLEIIEPGSISGSATVGSTLTYATGAAEGGQLPYTFSWEWRRASDNSVVQYNGANLTITGSLNGDKVYVVLRVVDALANSATQATSSYPPGGQDITYSSFPDTSFSPGTGPSASPATVNSGNLVGTSTAVWEDGPQTIYTTGPLLFQINGGGFGSSAKSVVNGDVIELIWDPAVIAASADNATLTGVLTNGTYENIYTFVVDRSPVGLFFNNLSSQAPSTTIVSDVVYPSAFNVPVTLSFAGTSTPLTSIGASVGGGAFLGSPQTVNPGQSIQMRGNTGSSPSTSYGVNIALGSGPSVTNTWQVTTSVATPTIAQPSIVDPTNGSVNINPAANVPAGVTLVGNAYTPLNGAGAHTSSDWQVYQGGTVNPTTSSIVSIDTTPVFGYRINRSVRFLSSKGSHLIRNFPSDGTSRRQWTFSCWVKKSALSTPQGIFVSGTSASNQINFRLDNGSNRISFRDDVSASEYASFTTTATFTNTSEWMNIVLSVDTTSSFGSQRLRLYVNGVEQTAFDEVTYYNQNVDTSMNALGPLVIGANDSTTLTNYLDGYLTGIYLVDGLALPPTSFGTLSGSSWIPVDYAGAFGIHGFKLVFDTNTDQIAYSGSMGKDTSGNNNDFDIKSIVGLNASSIGFYGPAATFPYLLVGFGAPGGVGGSDLGGGGGGGGGFLLGDYTSTTGSYLTTKFVATPAASPGVILGSWQVGNGSYGGNYSRTPCSNCDWGAACVAGGGGASGLPTRFSGGGGQAPICNNPGAGGGGGGAGGAGSTGTAGAGRLSDIRGQSETYGQGGYGGGSNTPGGAGRGLPGSSSGGIIIRDNSPSEGSLVVSGDLIYTRSQVTGGSGEEVVTITGSTFSYIAQNTYNSWLVDSPTAGTQVNTGSGGEVAGNYCTLSPSKTGGPTPTDGNLNYYASGGQVLGTLPMGSGKYYWELEAVTTAAIGGLVGISTNSATLSADPGGTESWAFNCGTGEVKTNGSSTSYGSPLTAGQILGVAFDADNGRLYFSIDGIWQNSGNPATSTNPAFSNLVTTVYYATFGGTTSGSVSVNFGQRPYTYSAPFGYGPLTDNPLFSTFTLTDSTQLSDFQVGDVVRELGGSNDGSGIVYGTNPSTNQISLSQPQGTWDIGSKMVDDSRFVYAPVPTTDPPNPSQYLTVVDVSDSTTNLTSYSIPQASLSTSGRYYSRVRYKTSSGGGITSDWSSYNQFTTASSFAPALGAPMGGGYFVGQINDAGVIYNLIVAPVTFNGLEGQYGGSSPLGIQYKTLDTADSPSLTAQGEVYGKPITDTFADSAHPVFNWCVNSQTGPNGGGGIGGYTDWYIPAKEELAILYFFRKPSTAVNDLNSGSNPNSLDPYTANTNYGPGFPSQTTSPSFQFGNPEAFSTLTSYWSSSEASGSVGSAWRQSFVDGKQGASNKTSFLYARAIRRVFA